MSALNEVLAHVAEICSQSGLSDDQTKKIALVIEELFSNTVIHGYQQARNCPVWISSDNDRHILHLIYQDEAPSFNPLNCPTDPPPSAMGGWGMRLIAHFSNATYQHANGRNTLTLAVKINVTGESNGTRAG